MNPASTPVAATCIDETMPADEAARGDFVSRRCEHWQASLDLADGPLLRVVHFRGDGRGRLLLVAHHIVIDGVSWRILLADLEQAYRQLQRGAAIQLAPKTSSFQQWGEALAARARSAALAQEKAWWLAQYAQPVEALPLDLPGVGNGLVATTQHVSLQWSAQETRQLLQQCNRAYRTQINELLLAGVYLGLRRWTGAAALRIALEGHGREAEPGADDLDLTQTVGWFTSLYPLTLSSPDEQVDTVVKSVKEHCRSVPGKGLGYGLLRHIAEDPALIEAEAGQRPALAFNYLGQADQSINEETFFQSAPEYAGASASARRQRRHPLVLKGLVTGGELRMTLEYSSERYHAQTMQRVAGYIVDGLRDVIAHCATRERACFTPSDFPLAQATPAQLDHWQQAYPGMTRLYPATSMQTGLYFHSQLDRSSYASQTLPVFRGVIDTQNFRRAWQAVIDRHDVFRTAFVGEGEQLHQLVVDSAELPWHEEDWRGMAAGEQALRLEAYRLQDRARGFDFRAAPLMRVALFRLDDDRHQLLWTHHHVLSDGWSMPVFYREVMEVYQALLERREPALPPAPPYERYIAWLQRQDAAAARGYWHAQLQHLEAPTALAVDKLPLSARAPGQREQAITLERADGDALQALAQTHRVTVNTLLQLAWAYLLHRYSGEDDVVFGVTVSGRPAEVAGIEQMIGLFINTIPFKVSFAGGHTLTQQLAALQADFLRANEFSHLSLAEIQRQSRVPAGTPLFDSLLVIGNYPIEAAMEAESRGSGLSVESKGRNEQTGYKLAFNIGLRGRVHIQCSYSGEDFDDATVTRLLGHFARILQQMPQLPDQPIQAIPLIGDAERRQFALWNTLPANYPPQACIHELFEAQAARTPEALAADFHGETLSYAQLNAQANRVAHHLRSLGVVPDTLVGLCAERSLDLIVGMLGILKAGAAYLPLDPDYPQDRIAYMLADSGVDIVLAQNDVLQTLPVFGDCSVLPLDAPLREMLLAGLPDGNVEGTGVHAGHLAYAIYTSGSTGQPKGVLIEHRNVVRLVASPNYVELSPGRVMAQASNSSFDAATFEIWGALANGMSLYHIGKDTLLDPRKLARALAQGRVSTLFVTTAVFNQMSIVDATGFRNLDCLLFGGEGVDVEAVNRVLAAGKPRHLMHVYGPTENTTFSTAFEIGARREDSYPIGTPISGTTQYVLDAQQDLVPVGVVGELYLGGAGVGRGYLKRPELTAERFVADPFAADGRGRLYRTGDLVRQLPDGAVQFVGRVDDQVKIRGFRIELGEIETRLLAHEAVCDAVVVARRDGGTPRLVAYVVCAAGDELPNETLLAKEWRRHLKQRLPDYMLPAAFVVLDALPLTHNGKVDKRRLPEPDYQAQQVYVAPETETERVLATIWQQVLRVEQVGIHDNFFEIGGDSILSIQLVSRANQAGIGITTKQLFEAQTVAELARLAPAQAAAQAPQDAVDGELTLLPIHHYFFAGDATDRDHFNQAVLLETPDGFTGDALRAVMTAVYARHDALRLRFAQRDGRWHASHAPLTATLIDASCVEETLPPSAGARAAFISERCAHWQASFDLTSGPLLRAVRFAGDGAGAGRLLLAAHHIVVDGVSWRILLGDVEQAYAQHLRGDAIALAPKSASYQQWGAALAAHARSDALLAQKDYWLAQHAETLPPLPRDRDEAGNGAIATTRNVAITLTPAETRALQQHCHTAYRTQINELLLAGVYLGMRRWSGAAGLRLRLEGHGREDLDDGLDLSQTVGWFTSIYPLVLRSASAETGAVIKAVKEQYRAIPQRGLGYGVLRYLSADEDLAAAAAAAGQHEALLFNYLGQFDQVINETTRFQSAPESIGPQVSLRRQRAAQLGFSGKIFGGQLQCSLNYSSGQYDAATMQSLAAHIEDGLREVIRHCQQRDAGGFTPSDFPLAHVDQTRLDAWQADYPDLARLYPATPMQAGLLFESLLDSSAYVVQNYPILRGSLDTAAFREAWQQVIARHDIFRTAFVGEGEAVHQLVSARALLPWHEEDWRGLDEDEQRTRFEAYRSADRRRGFDFAEAPLLRIALLRLGDDRYQLLWTLHHILLDGWCLPLVYRDVIELYRAAVDGRAAALDPPPSYERYIAWLQARSPAAARAYWRETLGTFDTPTPLVVDRLGSDGDSGHREMRLELSVAQTQALQSLAQNQRTTVNTLVQWCWACLLHRYSGETDVVFGATISGRPAEVPGVEEMVGLFINTIPVKVSFAAGTGIADSVARLQADFQRSVEHGYLALPEIQRESRVRPGVALFDSLLVFENYPLDAISGDSAGSDAATLEIERAGNSEQTNFRLSLIASLGRTLEVKFGYRAEHFGDATMQRLVGHFGRLLDQLPAALQSGHDIDLLDAAEVARFADWNRTDSRFPDDVCVHALIEAQVAATPDAIAVVADGQRLSYAELNRQANRLAHALLARGVRADDCVGLCMTRSAQMVVAILGILKAGAAYLPLDPDYPAARLDYMLRDSGAAWVLTQADSAQRAPGDPRQSICLDAADVQAELAAQPSHDPTSQDRALQPHNLAYAIYTSGSTGEPKGVLNEHRALVNRLDWMQKAYALDASDRVLQKTPYSFDVSVWEFLWTLMTGARLVMLAPHAHKDPDALCAAIREHGITTLHFVPSMLSALLGAGDWASCRSVRQVICSGEALGAELAARFFATGTSARLHNLYGPTEAAIDVSYWECRPEHAGHTVPIGRPIQNIQLHVLDAQGRQQPIGVPGELHIGGVGLARGYCNKPELTAQRFIRDHIARDRDAGAARLYRTGDLARWMPDGTLDFLGRIDHQVKIRGLRIELGEIETLLCRQPGINDAAVVAHGSGEDQRLVAYVATLQPRDESADEATVQRLRASLAGALPDYMVPAVFVLLERLPLSANGKIDRRLLPDPQWQRRAATPAGSATEAAIAAIWQRLLRLDEIDVLASFFELGGHSLLAVRMLGEVRLRFGITLAIRDVFERTTVRALAAFVDECVQRESLRQGLALDLADSNDQELIEL